MADYISDTELPTMVVRYGDRLVLRSVISGRHLQALCATPSWTDVPTTMKQYQQRQQIERDHDLALEALVSLMPYKDSQETPLPKIPPPPVVERAKNTEQLPELPPCKVQRNYCCNFCSFYTQNPRTHLLHLRDVHSIRLSIHCCQECQYASRYFQKLKRHIRMVHTVDSAANIYKQAKEEITAKNQVMNSSQTKPWQRQQSKQSIVENASSNFTAPLATSTPIPQPLRPSTAQKDPEAFFAAAYKNQLDIQLMNQQRYATQNFANMQTSKLSSQQTVQLSTHALATPTVAATTSSQHDITPKPNVNTLTAQSDADGHLIDILSDYNPVKGTFNCKKCDYTTHIKSRYNKHIKYHTMPMVQCDKCEFRTTYKWNLTRHLRSHHGNGMYKCSVCTFSADMKQSLTLHEANHHSPPVGAAIRKRRRCRVSGSDLPYAQSDIHAKASRKKAGDTLLPVNNPTNNHADFKADSLNASENGKPNTAPTNTESTEMEHSDSLDDFFDYEDSSGSDLESDEPETGVTFNVTQNKINDDLKLPVVANDSSLLDSGETTSSSGHTETASTKNTQNDMILESVYDKSCSLSTSPPDSDSLRSWNSESTLNADETSNSETGLLICGTDAENSDTISASSKENADFESNQEINERAC